MKKFNFGRGLLKKGTKMKFTITEMFHLTRFLRSHVKIEAVEHIIQKAYYNPFSSNSRYEDISDFKRKEILVNGKKVSQEISTFLMLPYYEHPDSEKLLQAFEELGYNVQEVLEKSRKEWK